MGISSDPLPGLRPGENLQPDLEPAGRRPGFEQGLFAHGEEPRAGVPHIDQEPGQCGRGPGDEPPAPRPARSRAPRDIPAPDGHVTRAVEHWPGQRRDCGCWMAEVGIHDDDDLTRRESRPGQNRPREASFGVSGQQAHPGVPGLPSADALARSIRGRVVDDEHFDIERSSVALLEDPRHDLIDVVHLIAGRQDDGDPAVGGKPLRHRGGSAQRVVSRRR